MDDESEKGAAIIRGAPRRRSDMPLAFDWKSWGCRTIQGEKTESTV
jgi:hypothetical protein